MSISLVHLRIELSKNHKLSTDIEYSGKKVSVDLSILIGDTSCIVISNNCYVCTTITVMCVSTHITVIDITTSCMSYSIESQS